MKTSKCLLLPFVTALGLTAALSARGDSYSAVVIADQPSVYYRFEDPAGSSTVTNAINGAVNQGTLLTDELGAYPKLGQAGVQSNSVAFHLYTENGNPQSSRIDVPYAPELNPSGAFTVELWARVTSWGTGNRCLVANVSSYNDGWWFRQEGGTTPRWLYVQNGGGVYMAGGSIAKEEWAHLVVTYDGTTLYFYANGEQKWSTTGKVPLVNTGSPLSIGGNGLGIDSPFDGNVDELAIYNKALTLDQIKLHYAVGLTNIAIPPVPAYIVADPAASSAYAGRTATFSVNASGTTPLSYQWYKDSTPLPSGTNDILKFTAAYADNGALYKVIVTNMYGKATSAPAALTIMTNILLDMSPASIVRNVGSKAAFIATTAGALPVTYQWYKGQPPAGTLISGATNQTLWLSDLKITDDNSQYYTRITNPWETTNSEAAVLTVVPRAVTVPVNGYAKVIMADDPVAFWRLDEAEGSTVAVDAAGSFDGTYIPGSGTLTYGVDTGIPRESNKAVAVSGKAQVQVPYALELNPHGPFTVEFWVRPASLNPGPDFRDVATSEGTGPHGWLLYQMLDNTLVWVLFSEKWDADWLGGAPAVEANTWYHLALTYDGSIYRTYCNGNLLTARAYDAFVPNGDGWTSFGFRFDGGGAGFEGAIDEPAFYNKALTQGQLQAHYLATVHLDGARSGNNLILTWPFGTLQQADQSPAGFTDMPAAKSPYTNAIGTTPKYFRVKVQ